MKRVFALILALSSIVLFVSCEKKDDKENGNIYKGVSDNIENAEVKVYNDLEYSVVDGCVIIRGPIEAADYNKVFDIPGEIDGAPVTEIMMGAFMAMPEMTEIRIPSSVKKIGLSAIRNCPKLEKVELSEGLVIIDRFAFYDCRALKDINIPSTVEYIEGGAFTGTAWLNSKKEEFVVEGNTLIHYNGNSENVTVPDGISQISYAFAENSKVKTVTLPEGVKTIGYGSFMICSSLETVNLPDGLTTIGNSAFLDCKHLKNIKIPDSVSEIGGAAFRGSNWPKCLEEEFVVVGDGFLIAYNGSDEEVRIPDGVKTTIGAFFECSNNVKTVIFPNSVVEIGEGTFERCTGIEKVVIPDSVKSIGTGAFYYCKGLKEMSIGSGLRYVADRAFMDCNVIKDIKCGVSEEIWNSEVFVGTNNENFISSLK